MYRTSSAAFSLRASNNSPMLPGRQVVRQPDWQARARADSVSVLAAALVLSLLLVSSADANDLTHQLINSSTTDPQSDYRDQGWQVIGPRSGGGGSADQEVPAVAPDGNSLTAGGTARSASGASPAPTDDQLLPANSQLIEFPDDQTRVRSPRTRPADRANQAGTTWQVQDDISQTINLDLFVGQVSVLGRVEVNRVAIGNGDIIRAEVLESGELLVIAASPGSSSLRLWHKDGTQTDYNIRVSQTDPETRVPLERMVRLRVRMVEFRKSALGRLGIDWSDSTAGPVVAAAGAAADNRALSPAVDGLGSLAGGSSPMSAYFGIASNISSRINLLAQNGDAVTLAEPVLSAMNGGQASFLAGGEVPYPGIGDNGQTQVEFKEYGVKLDVAPLIDGMGNVRVLLETEISQLDASVSVQGTPGLLTRRAQTEVTVRSGETIVISGLLSAESGTDTDMIPGLGKLPLLGGLFRTKSQRKSVNELVIFVTPEVVDAGQPMVTAREQRYLDASERRAEALRQHLPLMD